MSGKSDSKGKLLPFLTKSILLLTGRTTVPKTNNYREFYQKNLKIKDSSMDPENILCIKRLKPRLSKCLYIPDTKVKYLYIHSPFRKLPRNPRSQSTDMSRRHSSSRSAKPRCKSEDKMICINLAGLDDLCRDDSEASLISQGSEGDDYEEGEVAEDERGYERRYSDNRDLNKQHYQEEIRRSPHKQYHDSSDISVSDYPEPKRYYQDPPEKPRYQAPKHIHHVHSHGPAPQHHYPQQFYHPPPMLREQVPQPQPPTFQQQDTSHNAVHYQPSATAIQGGGPACSPQPQNTPPVQNYPQPPVPKPPTPQCVQNPQPIQCPQHQVVNNKQNPGGNCTNPTRNYSLNVTSCARGLEKLEAQFEKKPSHIEIRAAFILKTNPERYTDDIDNIAKTLRTETEKCIQNSPQEDNRGGNGNGQCFQSTIMMNAGAASELRKRVGTCAIPAWVKRD